MAKCDDYVLYKKLRSVIEFEKLIAKYRLNIENSIFLSMMETNENNVRDYLRARSESRRVGK
jgi:hypothetical protein